jgi:DNA-binding Xre family transcriptional regulator
MIRFTVAEVAIKEGYENPNQLSEASGLPYETCRNIWNDSAQRIDKSTLARLCAVLKARPGLLIEWTPTDDDLPRKRRGR